jgi:hypothetical protein
MASGLSRRAQCRLCGAGKLEAVVSLTPTPVADAYVSAQQVGEPQDVYPLELSFCHACAHVQLLDVVNPRLMFRDDYTYRSGSSKGIVKHFSEYAASVLARERPPGGSLVVEIGSNDGTLLRFFKEAGLRVLGIDPASDLAREATESGIETVPSFLLPELATRIRSERGGARIVTANNVFAHADDLSGMATCIRTLMAPDGVFVFEVSYLVDVVDKLMLGTIFHEHLSYHSIAPLAKFLLAHGLELIDVERVTIQGGSIICTAQHVGGHRPVDPRVGDLLRMERERGFDRAETFRDFERAIDRLKDDVRDLLGDLKSKGMVGAGYGAARGGTTLFYHFGLADFVEFLVDDSPDKRGQFTPGHHIPILEPEAIYTRKPDYVCVLAWIHTRAILKNHERYSSGGGRFIQLYPKLEVVSAA